MYAIRLAISDDAAFIEALFAEARRAELAGLPEALLPLLVAQQVRARAADWAHRFPAAVDHLVEVDGQRAGRLLLNETADHLRVIDIALAAAFRGRGLGSAILRALQARGRPIHLSVAVGNPARRLYERLGFRGGDDGVYAALVWPGHDPPPIG